MDPEDRTGDGYQAPPSYCRSSQTTRDSFHCRAGEGVFSQRAVLFGDFPELFAGSGEGGTARSWRERGDYDFGDWAVMVRELGEFDPVRCQEVLRWPLREALLCYMHRMQQQALIGWRHDTLVWSNIAPHSTKKVSPPKKPLILRTRPSSRDND